MVEDTLALKEPVWNETNNASDLRMPYVEDKCVRHVGRPGDARVFPEREKRKGKSWEGQLLDPDGKGNLPLGGRQDLREGPPYLYETGISPP